MKRETTILTLALLLTFTIEKTYSQQDSTSNSNHHVKSKTAKFTPPVIVKDTAEVKKFTPPVIVKDTAEVKKFMPPVIIEDTREVKKFIPPVIIKDTTTPEKH